MTEDRRFIQSTVEDLEYLRTWEGPLEDRTLRHGSALLRRLLVDGDFLRARRILGCTGKPMVEAPRLECFLDEPTLRSQIDVASAGGGVYRGLCIALGMVNKGSHALDPPAGTNPVDWPFELRDFIGSTSIFVESECVSRQVVIQYVANKLGGVHYDARRDRKPLDHKFALLDRNAERLFVQSDQGLEPTNAVYFEILSIAQLLAKSSSGEQVLTKGRDWLGA